MIAQWSLLALFPPPPGGGLLLSIDMAVAVAAAVAIVLFADSARRDHAEIALDVAARIAAEREVTRLEARYEYLVEHASDIIYETDPGGRFIFFNAGTVSRVLGYAKADLLGRHYLELVRPDWRARVEEFYRRQFYDGIALTYLEFPAVASDGREVWLGQNVQQVVENGRIVRHSAVCRDVTAARIREQELEISREHLRDLTAHIEDTREEERTRIAREIHDDLGGLLTAIQANLTAAIDRTERAGGLPDRQLAVASELVHEAVDHLRDVITQLRPSVLDHMGVWAAIEWQVERTQATTGLRCDLEIAPEVAATEVDPELGTAMFRIVQEALTNVVRHAEASRVRVHIRQSDDRVEIVLRDDGRGIDEIGPSRRGHWGIAGMRERARRFHGELQVTGRPGEGTTIVLRLPVHPAGRA